MNSHAFSGFLTTRRVAMWSAVGAILLLPLLAMQLTREVAWTGFDFAVAAVLLGGAGLLYELAQRWTASAAQRRLAGGVLLAAVLAIWAQGAVGIF